MRLADEDQVDDAIQAILNHHWIEHMPHLTSAQLAELLPVLEPVQRAPRRKPTVPKEYRKPAPKRVRVSVLHSSEIPGPVRSAVIARDLWQCQRCGRSITNVRAGLQHRRPRQMGGSKLLHTMANLVVLCGWSVDEGTCTAWVEVEDRLGAARDGWLVPTGVAPEEWPVLRYGKDWMQPGDMWVPALPHPDQIERGAVA